MLPVVIDLPVLFHLVRIHLVLLCYSGIGQPVGWLTVVLVDTWRRRLEATDATWLFNHRPGQGRLSSARGDLPCDTADGHGLSACGSGRFHNDVVVIRSLPTRERSCRSEELDEIKKFLVSYPISIQM